jgi:5-methyltetrahydropteroyltriglutamate--homocysteine methyltransferase
LNRSTWVKNLSEAAYPTRESLGDDIVAILRAELRALAAAGADVVQFDEPVLTELVFAGKSATRTFMCAALAAGASPEKELDLAVDLINRVVEGIEGPILAVHVCRGNWSQKEDILLQGPYDPLIPYFSRMKVHQFVLEYATPRAGSVEALRGLPPGAQIGYGAVNPRTSEVESPDEIAARVRRVAEVVGPEQVFLNPDCGFGTFADRPVATSQMAFRKLCALSEAAEILRRS